MKQNIAIVPGSFDPITFGHIDIAMRAAKKYDKVYIAVMINDQKNYMFTLNQRKRIAEAAFKNVKNISVISSDGMLWELAKSLGAIAIVKGYRNDIDMEYEKKMAKFNSSHYPRAPTVLLKSEKKYEGLSSTLVREKINIGADLSLYLPQAAIDEIYRIKSSEI